MSLEPGIGGRPGVSKKGTQAGVRTPSPLFRPRPLVQLSQPGPAHPCPLPGPIPPTQRSQFRCQYQKPPLCSGLCTPPPCQCPLPEDRGLGNWVSKSPAGTPPLGNSHSPARSLSLSGALVASVAPDAPWCACDPCPLWSRPTDDREPVGCWASPSPQGWAGPRSPPRPRQKLPQERGRGRGRAVRPQVWPRIMRPWG